MPADPFRLRVQKAITAHLVEVTPANGYSFDLSNYTDDVGRDRRRVFRGRSLFGENDPLPMVALLEDPRSLDSDNGSDGVSTKSDYRLCVQGFVEDDKDDPTDPAHHLAAEVISALVKAKANRFDILGLGSKKPCVKSMEIGQPVVRPADDEVSSVAFFAVFLTLHLVEDLEKPFA